MASWGTKNITWCIVWAISIAISMSSGLVRARRTIDDMNVIDKCWRTNPNWRGHLQQLAMCSIGYTGKMTNNTGSDVTHYRVTDHSDDALNPKPGTLRYGVTSIKGKVGKVDGDAIRMLTSSKIWIDHNTLYDCKDGLIDVTRGSTSITISNNWFRFQDKVMLLGHNDGYRRDKNMRVTVAFNHFGPRCQQRMPRIPVGYAHVVNNLYLGWGSYALGGSMNPSIKSEANLFIAPEGQNKESPGTPNEW
ncbi:UNVERIFIED_CONTAM: putative pectate lyase 4 [Sesamum angustifolium]|uniref:Pectate lyase 4 n=1 Tax=Sesamum angustifolium TaxID=2727405 RepID=A0AAW2LJ88_9LAMI